MQDCGSGLAVSGFQSALLFESPEEIYARVFREFKPRTPLPKIAVEFCRFANADSFIRMESGCHPCAHFGSAGGRSSARRWKPSPIFCLGKLFRRPAARIYSHRYRLYLNRRDVRRQMHLVRQIRGRKFVSGPQGSHYNLEAVFEALNARILPELLARPQLGWSRGVSRNMLGPLRSLAQCHHHQPHLRSARRSRDWPWST